MNLIYKYVLPDWGFGHVRLQLPKDAKILDIQFQNNNPQLWALVDPSAELELRIITVYGTGSTVPPNNEHLATVQQGPYVWHFFEETDNANT